MLTRSRRHNDDYENPAWPGLVDLFALGMVLVLLLWPTPRTGVGSPHGENQHEGERVKARLENLAEQLERRLGASVRKVEYQPNPQRVDVMTHVLFERKAYVLSDSQKQIVAHVAADLADVLRENEDALLVISGRADPVPLNQREPPRDNIELSALRAAEVSRLLLDKLGTDTRLRERVSVSGLGEVGPAPLSTEDTLEMRHLRTVVFQVQVNAAKLAPSGKQ